MDRWGRAQPTCSRYAVPVAGKKKKTSSEKHAADGTRMIAQNKRVRYEYEILETHECGIVLKGTEVKSLREGRCSLAEAFGLFKRGELWLVGANIPEYRCGNVHNHAPARDRKLLLHKKTLQDLERKVRDKGITLAPVSLYFLGSRLKLELALVRGKKLHDKRSTERDRSDKRDMDRAFSRRR